MTLRTLWKGRTRQPVGDFRRAVVSSAAILMVTTVAVTTVAAASSTAGAASVPARTPKEAPVRAKVGTTWVLTDGVFCETDTFGTHRTFVAAAANGDQGTFKRTSKITMTWTQGPTAGSVFLGKYRKGNKDYSGRFTTGGHSFGASLHIASGPGPSCAIVTAAPRASSVVVGTAIADTATITGTADVAPTGSVAFYECPAADAPCDLNANTTESLGSVPVAGSGDVVTATSPAFRPALTGSYCFSAFYSGGALDAPVRDDTPPGQCFNVTAFDGPSVSTSAATDSMALGEANVATTTVYGVVGGVPPTGTVTIYECGPLTGFEACTTLDSTPDPDTTQLGSPIALVPNSSNSSVATSVPFTPPTIGNYCFYAVYSGDANYPAGPESPSGPYGSGATECFNVARFRAGIAAAPGQSLLTLGDSETDSATITGVDGVAPTGFVDFTVCPGDTEPCTEQSPGAQNAGNLRVTDSGPGTGATVTSNDFVPGKAGVYCFSATYSIDPNYAIVTDGSLDHQCFTVTPAPPVVTSSPAVPSVPLGSNDSDNVTVTGLTAASGPTPTGEVDFLVCPATSSPCTAGSSGVIDLGSVPVTDQGVAATAAVTSASFRASTVGDYCFAALYSGDANYTSASDSSNDGCFTVTPAVPVAPVALGSPENSIGTGNLALDSAGDTSNVWAAVNGYCTAKENGDEFLSAFDGTWNGTNWECSATPTPQTPHAVANVEYNGDDGATAGYSYQMVTPTDPSGALSAPLTVQAYDPAYEPTQCPDPGNDPAEGGTSPDISLVAGTSITTAYNLTYEPVPGQPADDVSVPNLVVGPTSGPTAQPNEYLAASGALTTCGQWATLFTIPAGSPDGDYRLQVTTPQSDGQNSNGVNAYGLRVYEGPTFERCSTITSVTWSNPLGSEGACPAIEGESALSVYANEAGGSGNFYLAQVPASDAGQVLEVSLFDPGEGDRDIQLIDPDGNAVRVFWQTDDDCPLPAPDQASTDCAEDLGFQTLSGIGTSLDVSGTVSPPTGIESPSEFNDRRVVLAFVIPPDYTAANGGWWQIHYDATGFVTDRTTWSVEVSGSSSSAATGGEESSVAQASALRRDMTHRSSVTPSAGAENSSTLRHSPTQHRHHERTIGAT